MKIYGAGIAGLLAGCMFPTARIFEAGPEHQSQHKAVLRFRSSAVGDAVGVEFRRVRVNKGIWSQGGLQQPSIQLANQYSLKVIGKLMNRSIWNLDPVDRFIAPENFIEQLTDRCNNRISWNYKVEAEEAMESMEPAISTLPMNVMAKFVDIYTKTEMERPAFSYAPITVLRWRIPDADVFQTVYFPDNNTNLYRASITGDLLIAEYAGEVDSVDFLLAFGLSQAQPRLQPLEESKQSYGKIAPIDDIWRKRFIFDLTEKHKIYSLGRFGTWRNILLDDVTKDISVLKKLMNTSSYERIRHNAK